MMSARGKAAGPLAAVLCCALFVNGFEAGGYQACLQSIGVEYALNSALMGAFASVQLIAGLIAPLVFGPLADRKGKKGMLVVFTALQVAACLVIVLTADAQAFVVGVFLLGLTTSTVQYTALAALTDAYPRSGGAKIGIVTGMYSLGAVAAPLIVGALLGAGMPWRTFFIVLLVATGVVVAGEAFCSFAPREQAADAPTKGAADTTSAPAPAASAWVPAGIAILCAIMFVYVGVESGIAYFLNSFVGVQLGASDSYLALSLFWFAMIPSRLFCGAQSAHRSTLLLVAVAGTAAMTAAIGLMPTSTTAIVSACVLGLFCGAVYPCVLSFNADLAGGRTATATGLITAATGLGGSLITLAFGWMADALGMRLAFGMLGAFMLVDVVLVLLLLAQMRALRKTKQATVR
jgi:MFS family permease